MNILLWVLQIVLGVYFVGIGYMHFNIPVNLPDAMGWMYELSTELHYFSGAAEILGGIGLIVPGLLKMQARLTPLAAFGLALLMLGAALYHLQRGELQNIPTNIVLIAVCSFLGYSRLRKYSLG